jgi:hypothetical protein
MLVELDIKSMISDNPTDEVNMFDEVGRKMISCFPQEATKEEYYEPNISSLVYSEDEIFSYDNSKIVAQNRTDGIVRSNIDYNEFKDKIYHPNPAISNPETNNYNTYSNWSYNTSNRRYGYGYNPLPNQIDYSRLYNHMNIGVFGEGYHNMGNAQINAMNTTPRDILERPSNIVDFSNPYSVYCSQGGNVGNPNIIRDPYNYNPNASWYGANNGVNVNGWGNNIYGGYNQWGYSSFRPRIPSDFDIKHNLGVRARALPANSPAFKEAEEERERIEDTNRLPKHFTVKVVKASELEKQKKKEEVKDEEPKDIILPKQHELIWDDKKEKEIDELSEKIAVYNKAMAYVCYNLPVINGMTKEVYEFYKEAIEERLAMYIKEEKENPNLDYRLPYRYREMPALIYNPDGSVEHNFYKPEFVPEKKYDENGNRIYKYDRGRDLTDLEFKVFKSRALMELAREVQVKYINWVDKFNKGNIVDLEKYKNTVELDSNIDWNNPIAIRCYELKKREYEANRLRYFFRVAFGKSVSDKEFDKWWSGTEYDPEQNKVNNLVYNRKMEIYRQDYYNMINLKPVKIDYKRQYEQFLNNQSMLMDRLTGGLINKVNSVGDWLKAMNYMESSLMQEKINEETKKMAHNMANQYDYKKSLIRFGNQANLGNNYMPGATFGAADPRYGFPSNYIDITNTDGYQEKKAQFMNACSSLMGQNVPLRPIYM